MTETRYLFSYFILSIIGASFILLFALFTPSENVDIKTLDKIIIGLAFIICCIFGISLALKPNWISSYRGRKVIKNTTMKEDLTIIRQGHHPTCGQFEKHTIKFNNKILCAGCTGLILGAIGASVIMVIYIFSRFNVSIIILYFFIITGLVLIASNFMLTFFQLKNAGGQVISSMALIMGFLFIVLGIFELTSGIIYGLFGIIISFLWLDTRIQLSYWRHSELCNNCPEMCKAYLV